MSWPTSTIPPRTWSTPSRPQRGVPFRPTVSLWTTGSRSSSSSARSCCWCSTTASTSSRRSPTGFRPAPSLVPPGLSVLATSREALGVSGEHVHSAAVARASPWAERGRCPPCSHRKRAPSSWPGAEEARGGLVLDDTTAEAVAETVRAPRRHPPRAGARRGPDEGDDARGDRSPGSTSSSGWSPAAIAPPPGAPPDPAGRHRLVLRPARRDTAGDVGPGCRCAWADSISTPPPLSPRGSARDEFDAVELLRLARRQVAGRAHRARPARPATGFSRRSVSTPGSS